MIELACDAFGSCRVIAVDAREAMNELPRWRLELLAGDAEVDLAAAAGAPAVLTLLDELELSTRTIDLMIVEAAYEGPERHGHRYTVELSVPFWRCTLRRGYRLECELSALEMVQKVLEKAGLAAQVEPRIAGDTFQRDQITQYAETDWGFVERLLAEVGFSYWFEDRGGKCLCVIGDSHGSHDTIASPATLPFVDEPGLVPGQRSVHGLERSESLTSTGAMVRDFDVRQPDVVIEGKAGDDQRLWFEYPAFVPGDQAATRAAVRLEQLMRDEVLAGADSDCMRLQPGRLVTIEGAAEDAFNVEYVITRVEHAYREPTPQDPRLLAYRNRVELAPIATRPFRPAVPATRPRLDGLDRAITTGPSGEEIHVDDLARVKLRFLWDQSGITDDKSSTWARGLQWSLTGSMFLPRVGWEVGVMFVDGSPDRPFVVQRLYNGTAVVPYSLPGAAATTAIKSVSSPGGGGITELRLADDAGKMAMYIHAAKDQSVTVGSDSKAAITASLDHDITLSLTSVINGAHDILVRAFRTVDVATDYATNVKGSHVNIVAAAEIQWVSANRVVETSTYFEGIGGAYVLSCNQSNLIVNGGYVNINIGRCRLRALISGAENVAGARVEVITQNHHIEHSGTFTDNPWGLKRISAGDGVENAGSDVGCSAPWGLIQGAIAEVKAPDIAIHGRSITIKAPTLKAEALELSGGALKCSGSTLLKTKKLLLPAGGKIE
jgi:type VI secretion system secreted protein VgrG